MINAYFHAKNVNTKMIVVQHVLMMKAEIYKINVNVNKVILLYIIKIRLNNNIYAKNVIDSAQIAKMKVLCVQNV